MMKVATFITLLLRPPVRVVEHVKEVNTEHLFAGNYIISVIVIFIKSSLNITVVETLIC